MKLAATICLIVGFMGFIVGIAAGEKITQSSIRQNCLKGARVVQSDRCLIFMGFLP